MAWVFFLLLAIAVVAGVYQFTRPSIAKLANKWPSAKAVVTDWRIKVRGGGEGGSTFHLSLKVRMDVDGRPWTSIIDAGEDFDSEQSAIEFARQLREAPILVYYDPQDPSRGSLNRYPLSIVPKD